MSNKTQYNMSTGSYLFSIILLLDDVMTTGTVIRTGQVNMLESRRVYRCDKCHHQCIVKVTEDGDDNGCHGMQFIKIDFEQYNIIPKPSRLLSIIKCICSYYLTVALEIVTLKSSLQCPLILVTVVIQIVQTSICLLM